MSAFPGNFNLKSSKTFAEERKERTSKKTARIPGRIDEQEDEGNS